MQSQYEADLFKQTIEQEEAKAELIAKMKQEEADTYFKKEYGPMKRRIMLQPKQDKKKVKNKSRMQKQSKRKNR